MAGAIGVVATRAHATEIHPEAVLTFRTIDPAKIETEGSGGAFQPVRQYNYQSQVQPRQSEAAPPGPYYGGYYDPYYYPYGYYPYGYYPYYGLGLGFYGGYGFGGGYGFRGGGFRGGGFGGGGFRGGGGRR